MTIYSYSQCKVLVIHKNKPSFSHEVRESIKSTVILKPKVWESRKQFQFNKLKQKYKNHYSTHSLFKERVEPKKHPTYCYIHTESNIHTSAITRCPNLFGQLKQMDARRCSYNFL